LRVQFSQTWPWATVPWQDLWNIVQWQDYERNWRDAGGWQGTPDELQDSTGKKIWWVAEIHLGRGPYRWLFYQDEGGRLLAASGPSICPALRARP
jgi:hypothetical protein